MKPSVEELETLVQVVTSGSVTAAAARLRTTKSVVSKRLSRLESLLGTSLFRRAGRTMRPTEVGLAVYERAVAVLAGVDGLLEEVAAKADALQGTIRLAGPQSFGNRYLSPLIADFLARHPRIDIVLDLDDRFVDLRAGAHDVAIRIGRLEDSALKARKLATSRRGIYCAPDYARRHGAPDTVEGLAEHACLGYANAASGHIWRFEPVAGGPSRSLGLPARLLSNSGEALRDAAIAGLGIAALPAFMAHDAVATGALAEITLPGWTMAADTIYAVHPESLVQSLRVRALIDHFAQHLKPPLPWA
jgi:DNA-binding transcriptional LysR family regulator